MGKDTTQGRNRDMTKLKSAPPPVELPSEIIAPPLLDPWPLARPLTPAERAGLHPGQAWPLHWLELFPDMRRRLGGLAIETWGRDPGETVSVLKARLLVRLRELAHVRDEAERDAWHALDRALWRPPLDGTRTVEEILEALSALPQLEQGLRAQLQAIEQLKADAGHA